MSIAEARPAVRKWEWPRYTNQRTMQSIPAVLWTLFEMGGELADKKSGMAASKLVAKAAARGWPIHPQTSISAMFGELENGRFGRCIYREVGNKRTYLIRLLLTEEEMPPRPREMKTYRANEAPAKSVFAKKNMAPDGSPTVYDSAPPIEPDPEPAPHPGPSGEPRPDDPNTEPPALSVAPAEPVTEPVLPNIPQLVAIDADVNPMSLLLQINQLSMQATMALLADVGTTPVPTVDDDEREAERTRLATMIDENNRLRRKLNEATETLVAKSKECEGLRKALLVAQGNMKAIQNAADLAPQREAALRRLKGTEKFMQERPRTGVR